MIRRRILYLLILAACVWLVMLYTFQELRFLLGVLLVLPPVCLAMLLLKAPRCRVEAGELPSWVTRGTRVRLAVKAVYRGVLPLAGLNMKVTWRLNGNQAETYRKQFWGLGVRCEREIELEFAAQHCGQAEFQVVKAGINDFLGLFSMPVKKSGRARLWIAPVITPLPEAEGALITDFLRRQREAGDGDYSVRAYRPGDSLRSVHWKLTAKEEELQVKDFRADNVARLFLHMTDALLAEPEKRDLFLDRACSLMSFLSENAGEGLEVGWIQEGALRSTKIETGETLYPCIRELIEIKAAGVMPPEESLGPFLQGCRLEADGRLYLGEQCVYGE